MEPTRVLVVACRGTPPNVRIDGNHDCSSCWLILEGPEYSPKCLSVNTPSEITVYFVIEPG